MSTGRTSESALSIRVRCQKYTLLPPKIIPSSHTGRCQKLSSPHRPLGRNIQQPIRARIARVGTVPAHVAADAAADAQYMCDRHYGFSPEVMFLGSNLQKEMPYIPSHLYYILFELIKNSLRATIEHHQSRLGEEFDELEDSHLPAVKIVISDGQEQVRTAFAVSFCALFVTLVSCI